MNVSFCCPHPVSAIRSHFVFGCLLTLLLSHNVGAQSAQQQPALSLEQQEARDALNQGVAAFKNAQFDEAVRLFQRAKQLDPSLQNASLYLATAYASQYIPGAPSEENQRMGKLATDIYREALQTDPQNLQAIDGLASILYQRAGQPFSAELFNEAKSYHQKHIDLQSNDPQPHYSVGVIDWALAYKANAEIRQKFNSSVNAEALKDTDPLPEGLRIDYAHDYGWIVDEGIDYLERALTLKPDYDDAMTYLNLLYRRKADMAANADERNKFNETADKLLDQVVNIKQRRAAAPASGSQPN